MRGLLIACAMVLTLAAQAFDIYEFETVEQEQQYRKLITELRCPKCQNQSIGDSDADIAEDMRRKTAELINQGMTNDEVVEYFRARYGDFVSYRPPMDATTAVLWFGPAVILLLGSFGVVFAIRRALQRNLGDDEETL